MAEIQDIYNASDITLSKMSNYYDLNADTLEEGDKKFNEKTRELWKDFAVHGIVGKNKEGQTTLKNVTDLDGKCALAILGLAGIDTSNVSYVPPGSFEEGKINLDTGNKTGVVLSENKETVFFDHHGTDSKRDQSATKVVYETMIGLGLLEKVDYLDKMVEFVTQNDNRNFPNEDSYYKDSWRTVLGLQRFIKPEKLIEYFKAGRKPIENLSVDDLKSLGLEKGSEEQKRNLEQSLATLNEMLKDGFIVYTPQYGELVVDINKKVAGGFQAAKAFGCGAYMIWSPNEQSFFITTVKPLKHEFKQGIKIRETMWIKNRTDGEPLKVSLQELITTMTDGKTRIRGKLFDICYNRNHNATKRI